MTTMVQNIKYVMSVLSRQVVVEPNQRLCGPRSVARAPSRAPTNPLWVGGTRPHRVGVKIAAISLQEVGVNPL